MQKGRRNPFRQYYRKDLLVLIKNIAGSEKVIEIWMEKDLGKLTPGQKYIALVNIIGDVKDVQSLFQKVRSNCTQNTRLIITYYNYLWEPVLKLAEILALKEKQPALNWLTLDDIENLLKLTDFETVSKGQRLLLHLSIPLVTPLINRFLANLPLINRLCLTSYIIARPINFPAVPSYSVSIVIPARNEAGNIQPLLKRLPRFADSQEVIIVEDHSRDNTWQILKKESQKYKSKNLRIFQLSKGIGKAAAVYFGIEKAQGDIIIILDSDLSVPPEDLPKFYNALTEFKGEFINGSRLVYPMEKQSMRFLNLIANKLFSIVFSWTLGTRFTDTLCGTKAFFKKDFKRIRLLKKYFGTLDPFGDFDLIFGTVKLNLKVAEVPVRYRARIYGKSNIRRFTHGLILFKMWLYALWKFKFS